MQTIKLNLTSMLLAAIAIVLAGCASTVKDTASREHAVADTDAKMKTDQLLSSISAEARVKAQDVDKPYIVSAAIPIAREIAMPAILRRSAPVTSLGSRQPIDFQTALQQLSADTGLTFAATPDALAPMSNFVPKASASPQGGAGASAPAASSTSSIVLPLRVVLMAESRPLWEVLDDLAAQSYSSWRPTAGGALFYRLETRLFALQGAATTSSTTSGLGRTGAANAMFSADGRTTYELKAQGMLASVGSTVDAMLTSAGRYTLNIDSGTLVVTDTAEALARVDAFVKEQNTLASRRIRIVLETIDVVDKRQSDFGVEWDALAKLVDGALSTTSLASLVSRQAGSVRLSPEGQGFVVARALEDTGLTVSRKSFPLLTTNGRPVSQAIRNTFSYVDTVGIPQPQTGSTGASATGSATVSQKTETTGTFLTLQPTAKSDGTIFLQVSIDVTSAGPIVPFTVGTGQSAVQVQQITIDGAGSVQEVPLRSGKTVLIGGLETSAYSNNERRLGEKIGIALGGSDSAKQSRTRTVLLVTAVVEDNI